MANNIYRFRRLKWGDPKTKFKMMGQTEPLARGPSFSWDIVGIVVGLGAIGLLITLIL